MTSINQKTGLVAIAAIATLLAVSTIAIGSGRTAFAAETTTITKHVNNTGVNVQTETDQPQTCQTVGGTSGISGSCLGTSTDTVTQSGGILKK
jgi:C4-dicarboxylate transporter